MEKVTLSLRKTYAYGRSNYYPACENSELIIRLLRNRIAFNADEVELMVATGWKIEIEEEDRPHGKKKTKTDEKK